MGFRLFHFRLGKSCWQVGCRYFTSFTDLISTAFRGTS